MNFANPTSVQIGMSGVFVGIRYRVVGRVTMGVKEGGQIYYWNEFNLVGDSNQSATLVYENAENGPEWKLFTLFEPQNPITAQEAASKKIGDPVNFDGAPMRVTLVDESRVYHIEGVAPEGVEVGDVAHYFNAESPGKMLVASWTGDEIEFYHGLNLPGGTVPHAFGFLRDVPQNTSQNSFNLRSSDDRRSSNLAGAVVGIFLLAVIGLAIYSFYKSDPKRSFREKPKLASPHLLGQSGSLDGKNYRVVGEASAEISEVGRRYFWHEYKLADSNGDSALLIFGAKNGSADWILLTSFEPANSIAPPRAAALRVGDNFTPDSTAIKVTELFQSRIQQAEGELAGVTNGTIFYGLKAEDKNNWLLVRWNEGGIMFYRGKPLAEKMVSAAFKINGAKKATW